MYEQPKELHSREYMQAHVLMYLHKCTQVNSKDSHLTPAMFHEELKKMQATEQAKRDTVLIDCRYVGLSVCLDGWFYWAIDKLDKLNSIN